MIANKRRYEIQVKIIPLVNQKIAEGLVLEWSIFRFCGYIRFTDNIDSEKFAISSHKAHICQLHINIILENVDEKSNYYNDYFSSCFCRRFAFPGDYNTHQEIYGCPEKSWEDLPFYIQSDTMDFNKFMCSLIISYDDLKKHVADEVTKYKLL